MTGAPLPQGADAIVPVEDTDSEWHAGDDQPLPARVTINSAVNVGAAVRRAGENIHAGQKVLPAGIVLRPQDIGMAASIGVGRVPVVRQPRAALLTTGDELASPDTPLAPGQIYDANSYTLAGLVQQAGAQPIVLPPARDSLESVRALFSDALAQQPDIIISSAGVSVGAADYVRVVLEEMGRVDFWRINLRPGKPLAYGHVQGIPFFGLPGNPVSAMVTFDVIVRPALLKMLGQRDTTPLVHATTAEPIESDGRRSYLRVTLERRGGQLVARLTGTQSSGALMSMVLADGLLIVPEGERFVPAGTELAVRLLRGQA
jgi:molybdopterin molybdotransferase